MGTNYYIHPDPCPNPCAHCRAPEVIHLGKSSSGWAFLFRAYPALGDSDRSEIGPVVMDYASWVGLLSLGEIRAEYGVVLTREEMLEVVSSTRNGRSHLGANDFHDYDGNAFSPADFC